MQIKVQEAKKTNYRLDQKWILFNLWVTTPNGISYHIYLLSDIYIIIHKQLWKSNEINLLFGVHQNMYTVRVLKHEVSYKSLNNYIMFSFYKKLTSWIYVYQICIYAHVYTDPLDVTGIRCSEIVVTCDYEIPCGRLELDLGGYQEQWINSLNLWVISPSLYYFFKN